MDVYQDRFDAFLFDLDGVIHIGDRVVPGAPDVVRQLQDAGKAIRFVTNNSRATREAITRKLAGFDIRAEVDEIVSSSWATAAYLEDCDVTAAFLIGENGFATEVRGRGVTVRNHDVDAVVVGLDRGVTYDDIAVAARHIHYGDAAFIAANADGAYPTEDGIAPGTGAITSAIQSVTDEPPVVVGKPEPRMFELVLRDLPANTDRAVMVGDNFSSDIVGAHRAGLPGIFVSSDTNDAPTDCSVEPVATISDVTALLDG